MNSTTLALPGPDGPLEFAYAAFQGLWTKEQSLCLSDQTNRLVEYIDGRIEVLPKPTTQHQVLLLWLLDAVRAASGVHALILPAPLRLRLPSGRYREPDILLVRDASDPRVQDDAWHGADLVVEIVSPRGPERDLVAKRADYAAARIPEYWIVDPRDETVIVLTLVDTTYREGGVYRRDQLAASVMLAGVTVDVTALYDAPARVRGLRTED
jgi:Uma2 family endonuclease